MPQIFGTIVRRKGRHPHGRYRIGGKEYRTPARLTEAEVRTDLNNIHAKIKAGQWIDPTTPQGKAPTVTLEKFLPEWTAQLTALGRSVSTIRSYTSIWNSHILKHLGKDTTLADITDIEARTLWNAETTAGTSATTRLNVMLCFSAAMRAAQDFGYIQAMPKLPRGALAKRRQKTHIAYTKTELDQLIENTDPYFRAAVLLGSFGALRSGEVSALQRKNVKNNGQIVRVDRSVKRDKDGRLVFGPPKSEAGVRTISIPAPYSEMLVEHLEQHTPAASDALLYSSRSGRPLDDRALRTAYRNACEKAGLPQGRFHDLRHSGLTLYGQAGATTADLMARAGAY